MAAELSRRIDRRERRSENETDTMSTQIHEPAPDELLALLNHAFEGWGSEAYFRWKYTSFPRYSPNEDNFVVRNDSGDLVATRRLFQRRLELPDGRRVPVHVHGGTAVHEAYRGRGHYTEILEESMDYSRRTAEHIFTFNRKGKITTKHHRKNGWRWITLPISVRVLSPSTVLSHYVLESEAIRAAADRLSGLDRRLTAYEPVGRLLSRTATAVHGATCDDLPIAPRDGAESNYRIDALDGTELADELVAELFEHLAAGIDADYRFDRSVETMRHCVSYPGSRVFVAREGAGRAICGFVVAGLLEKDGLTECRILEQTWQNPAATRELLDRVEGYARGADADVVVLCSEYRPGPEWLELGTEYMMWPPEFGDRSLPTDRTDWRVTVYDVL